MSNKQKRIGICIYCGLQKKITSDHIPPKKIFKKPLPNNLITVDCCSKCNSGFSKDDEEFKRLIWSAKGADKHEAFDNKTDEIIRSINRPTAIAYKHKVINSMKNAEIYSENDLVSLGKFETVVKLSIDGMTSGPFPATTLPLPNLKNDNRADIIRMSKERYGRKAM